jgi:hypothetical protein
MPSDAKNAHQWFDLRPSKLAIIGSSDWLLDIRRTVVLAIDNGMHSIYNGGARGENRLRPWQIRYVSPWVRWFAWTLPYRRHHPN